MFPCQNLIFAHTGERQRLSDFFVESIHQSSNFALIHIKISNTVQRFLAHHIFVTTGRREQK